MTIWKAAAASGVVAIVVTIASTLFASGGRMYVAEVDWAKVDTMNYREANDYLLMRSRSLSHRESLKNAVAHRAFWLPMMADGVIHFVVGFAVCVVHRRLAGSPLVSRSVHSS